MSSRVRAVGFDLWETLITNPADVSHAQKERRLERIEETLASHGYAQLAHDIDRAHRDTWKRCQDLYWSRDEDITCRRQVEHFLEELGLNPADLGSDALDALEDAYATAALDVLPHEVEGATETLRELQQRNLRVGLISNTGRTPGYILRDVLARLGLAPLIDVMVFSNEHGVCKPQLSIFEELRRELGASADEMVFVGDNVSVDILGAQRAGMRGIHFDPPRRGVAIAPSSPLPHDVTPWARITRLAEVIDVVERSWTKTS